MITKEVALTLVHGQTIHDKTAYDSRGNPKRWRVNGRCKTWKTRPTHFRVPIIYGLGWDHSYLTHENADDFELPD